MNNDQINRKQEDLDAFMKGIVNPAEIRTQLQLAMWKGAGIFRNASDLTRTLETINTLSLALLKADSARNLAECCTIRNMCLTSSLICRSALIRTESRGAHVRVDVPQRHDARRSPFNHTFISSSRKGIEEIGSPA